MKFLPAFSVLLLGVVPVSEAADEWLDRLDEALTVATPDGNLRARLSGLIDLEAYRFSDVAPGLIDTPNHGLFNPRLILSLDAQFGSKFYFFAQSRVDRGFDPSDDGLRMRLDEYALRFTPWEDGRLNIQIGQFATVIGNWMSRHLSWENPFINNPLPYEGITAVSDLEPPRNRASFGHVGAQEKYDHLPMIWGPSYTTGISAAGRLGKFEYAAELKNAALSSRPASWSIVDTGFEHPTVSARAGFRPNEAWNFGVSASRGSYLREEAETALPTGREIGDYAQSLLGADASYAWHHLQIWAEIYGNRFEVPRVGNADSLAYYLEAKYKFTPQFSGALRWGQQFFTKVGEGQDRGNPGPDRWQIDAALAYRFTAHTQVKLQYTVEEGELGAEGLNHVWAAQFTLRF